jgi:hypothetical protein
MDENLSQKISLSRRFAAFCPDWPETASLPEKRQEIHNLSESDITVTCSGCHASAFDQAMPSPAARLASADNGRRGRAGCAARRGAAGGAARR